MKTPYEPLLKFIRQHESRGDYNAIWHGIRKSDYPSRPLTRMTIREVLDWQDSVDRLYRSEASGAYQMMEDTLRGILVSKEIQPTELFNEKTQDDLAVLLLKRRGLDKFISGKMSAVEFGQYLSMEWASLPCTIKDKSGRPAKGQSYYAGDGLNASGTKIPEFMAVLEETLKSVGSFKEEQTSYVKEPESTGWIGSLVQALAALLTAFSKRKF